MTAQEQGAVTLERLRRSRHPHYKRVQSFMTRNTHDKLDQKYRLILENAYEQGWRDAIEVLLGERP